MKKKVGYDGAVNLVDAIVNKPGPKEETVSLAPLDTRTALAALLAIPDPEKTKPRRGGK